VSLLLSTAYVASFAFLLAFFSAKKISLKLYRDLKRAHYVFFLTKVAESRKEKFFRRLTLKLLISTSKLMGVIFASLILPAIPLLMLDLMGYINIDKVSDMLLRYDFLFAIFVISGIIYFSKIKTFKK
jgi:hypothetical protein